ncbi:MAG TPA: hypothetical protein VGZ29_04230 [Terriglobia bacterium]|nr:hypothetical protein [Terriglobia bacterium]
MKNIGGRVVRPGDTHIELSPDEADALRERLSRSCQREIEAWLKEQDLTNAVRDSTGVVTGREAPEDPHRPADDSAFAENEARIARAHTEAARSSRKPPVDDPSVIQYEGNHGFPSFCQIVHRKQGERVQFALIHMPNGGTSPTNMFESLATHLRQRFYPKVDAGRIDWFDVVPPDLYQWMPFTITVVTMQHANGVYSDPSWYLAKDDEDWRTLILDTITRGQPARHIAQAAPHPDSSSDIDSRQPQAASRTKRR